MIDFLFKNIYFIVNVISILVLFLSAWLVFDSNKLKNSVDLRFKMVGFILIGIGFILEQILVINSQTFLNIKSIFLCAGLIAYFVGTNKEESATIKKPTLNAVSPILFFSYFTLPLINVFASFLIAFQLYKKYSENLMKEYKNLIVAFIAFGMGFLLEALFILDQTNNVVLASIADRYGVVWYLYIFFRITALIFLVIWVFGYLRFRIYPLLFSIIAGIVVVISIMSAFLYSFIVYSSIKGEFLLQLEKNVETVQFNINGVKDSSKNLSRSFGLNEDLQHRLETNNYAELNNLLKLFIKSTSTIDVIHITDVNGNIVASTNSNLINSSISSELFVNRALAYKEENSGLFLQKTSLNNNIIVKAVSPVIIDDIVKGVVQIEYVIDNGYADSVKNQTGLDVIIFAEDKRSATTFVAEDGVSRLVNLREGNNEVINQVLEQGKVYKGETKVLNSPYFAAYVPIFDPRGIVIGMIFTGSKQSVLIDTIEKSNSDMFILSLVIATISIFPAKYFADFIDKNYKS